MYIIGIIPLTDENLVEDVISKPGFVKIKWRENMLNLFHERIHHEVKAAHRDIQGTPEYLHAEGIRRRSLKKLSFKDDDKLTEGILADLFQVRPEDIRKDVVEEVQGPSACISFSTTCPDGHLLDVSIDSVASIALRFWPKIAKDWPGRKRFWPNPSAVSDIVENGVHIVAKTSPGGEIDKEWRLSFSAAEKRLAKERNETQRKVYFIVKSLFYCHIIPFEEEGKHLPSYVIKTIMLWACERLSPEEWKADHLEERVMELLLDLQISLEDGTLRHYFIPELNVLEGFSPSLIEKAYEKATTIVDDLYGSLPEDTGFTLGLAQSVKDKFTNFNRKAPGYLLMGGLLFLANKFLK